MVLGFNRVKAALKTTATEQKKHEPLPAKTDAAVAAAKPPANERESLAGAKQVGVMDGAPKGVFDKAGFVTKMVAAVSGIAPRSKEELGNFPNSGKAQGLKGQLQTDVTGGRQQAQQGLDTAAKQPPNPGAIAGKPVTPLTPEAPGPAPQVAADGAAPDPHTPAETALDSGPTQVRDKMTANNPPITEEQLQKANEPSFSATLKAKKTLDTQATTAPTQFKQQESGILDMTKHQMQSGVDTQVGRMYKGRTTRLGQVVADQHTAQGKDEARHQAVTNKVGDLYTQTKAEVDRILAALPGTVNTLFETGAATASRNLEQFVKGRVDALSAQRHELSWDLWKDVGQVGNAISDTFAGIPDDQVAPIYNAGRQAYIDEMTGLATGIANTIERELSAAKSRIACGKTDIDRYVNGLPQDLQQVGRDAQREMSVKFDDLSQDIDTQVDQLQGDLTTQFTQAGKQADDLLQQMKAENKGLLGKALDAIEGTISTINGLKDLLLGVLSKARDVIGRILSDPIGFLGNLVAAVGQGLNNFVAHIGKHLQDGLTGWLFGALGGAGIQLPAAFDLKGIVSVATQVLGLTYDHVRQRAVKIVGAQAVGRVEKVAGFFKTLLTGGIGGLWTFIKDQLGNLKELILGEIRDWVTNKVVQAGISWLLGLLTPAGAFIKACQTIINIVQFFLERGSQILTLVNSILDSLGAIAAGNLGAAAKKVEDSLANALPVAISFLASLLGLGGISGHIRKLIEKAQEPINKAIDTAIKGAMKALQWVLNSPVGKAVTNGIDKGKALYQQGKAAATDAYQRGKGAVTGAYNKLTGKDNKPPPGTAAHDAAKGQAPAGSLAPVIKSFAMQGEGHTLILTPGPAAKVEMASKRDLLSNKIGRAVGRIEAVRRAAEREHADPALDPTRKTELATTLTRLAQQKTDLTKVGRSAKAAQQAATPQKWSSTDPYALPALGTQIEEVIAGLQQYAEKYGAGDVEDIRELARTAAIRPATDQRPAANTTSDPAAHQAAIQRYLADIARIVGGVPGATFQQVEQLALTSEWQMEAGLRITNPVFGATASSAIKAAGKAAGDDKDQQATVRAGAQEWEAISKKVLAILRNPQLSLTERKRDLQQTLAQLQRSLASHGTLFNISAFDFAGATAAVAALRAKTFGTELRLADDGTLYRGARKLGTFQQLTADVLQANQIYAQHGILREFVISVSTPPSSEIAKQVSILTRQRQPNNRPPTLPPQLDPVAAPVPPNRPQYLIDSGVGESAFALDLVPAADRRAGPLLQTEFGPSYVDPAMLRRDLGWQRAAPRGDQHSVVVLGDTLQTMQTLVGQRNVRRIFINNVNAHYSPAHYATLAQQLSAAIAPGGQVEVQWDSTPEYPDRPDARPGDRGHIDGPTLAQALAAVEGPHKRRFRVERQTPIRNYAYSIEPSRRPGGAAPGTKVPPSPVPEARWVFVLE